LDEAVSRIKQACENRSKDLSPFFFMVGAGISYPSVPLAMEIGSACKEVAHRYGRTADARSTSPIDQYSHWFETAYAERYQRQEYLRGLIEGKPITHANFRLAHLLLETTVSNIVVTTNFDDFLTKALSLFGKPHIVCDHPQTVDRINHNAPIVQIVHLHGSYWFYDCCNLRGELEDRAQQSPQTTLTMASLLNNVLWDRSPIVIGYSGWEGDVFTEALRRRLATSLRSNAYWFCYRRTEVESLPDWLKYHSNISFVVPTKKSSFDSELDALKRERVSEADQTSLEGIEVKGFSSKKDGEPVLPADTVFDRLIQAFDLKAPELTKDPLGFFAAYLDNSLPKDSASDSATDIYGIKRVIERMRRAKQRDDEESAKASAKPSETQLDQVRDALRRAGYREAVEYAATIELKDLSTKELDELADAMWAAAQGLSDNAELAIAAIDIVVTTRDRLAKQQISSSQSETGKVQVAIALFNKGYKLEGLNRSEEAIEVYDDLVQRFGDEIGELLREYVAMALVNKGYQLGVLGRSEQEIRAYDEVIKRYGEDAGGGLREQVAKALRNRGVTLERLGRSEEAFASFDEILDRYDGDPAPALREQMAKSLVNKGYTLGTLNRNEEALAIHDEVINRYTDDPAFELQEQVAKALVNKGVRLGVLNRNEEAIAVYDEVIKRFGDDTREALQRQVARAKGNKLLREEILTRSRKPWDS
jgi:tetratricopeptide (TPR) repeat protein